MVIPSDSMLWHPNSIGHHIYNLNLALIIFSTVFISLRLYVRKAIVKALGWDDFLAVLAWVCSQTRTRYHRLILHVGALRDSFRPGDGYHPLRNRRSNRRCTQRYIATVSEGGLVIVAVGLTES